MNGPTTTKFINELYNTSRTDDGQCFIKPNIVCYTANSNKETLGKALASGMTAQYNKPFLIEELK
jgi:CheY-like chemotaxis protein